MTKVNESIQKDLQQKEDSLVRVPLNTEDKAKIIELKANSEMINNIVDLTSSYTELVDNLVSVSSVWAINWYLTLGTV